MPRSRQTLLAATILTQIWLATFPRATNADELSPTDDGNHPQAKSEAWTWMGHLNFLTRAPTGTPELSRDGVALLHYYTRNLASSGAIRGSMTFKTSALTYTRDGIGTRLDRKTTYAAKGHGALRTRAGKLELDWRGESEDRIQEVAWESSDDAALLRALALFPGLQVAPGFHPRKTKFIAGAGRASHLALTLYSIWPRVAPTEDGRIRFLGMDDTYTFSEPMILAYGTVNGRPAAGLLFLDRQWGTRYFGEKLFGGLGDLLDYGRALPFSHSWSAFHVFAPRTREWSFVHLWRQYSRKRGGEPDTLTDYSDLIWMRDGATTGHVAADRLQWRGSEFVRHEKTNVMLNYAAGRTGYFPSRYELEAPEIDFKGVLAATPSAQFQNQPIYLFEGYASGRGTWRGEPVELRGRLESSRLLFRDADYQEMLDVLDADAALGATSNSELAHKLRARLRSSHPWREIFFPFRFLWQRLINAGSLLHDIDLKAAIFGQAISGHAAVQDPTDPDVMIYR